MSRVIRAAGTVATLLILAACGSGGDDPPGTDDDAATTEAEPTTSTTSPQTADPAFVQLCEVLASARSGALEKVHTSFDHGPLHTLANAAIDVDRAVAARLLEAKEAVESGLTDPAMTAERIAVDLEALTDATREAYAITDAPQPPCEELP